MNYKIASTKKNGYLTGFYPNGGFGIGDVFAFSTRGNYSFNTEEQAQQFILRIKKECIEQLDRWGDWTEKALKFYKTLNIVNE